MKKIVSLVLMITMILSSLLVVYAEKTHIPTDTMKEYYELAKEELVSGNLIDESTFEEKDEIVQEMIPYMTKGKGGLEYFRDFDEYGVTLLINEEGYCIGYRNGDILEIYDTQNGVKTKSEMSLNYLETNERVIKEDPDPEPFAEEYEQTLDSFRGLFEFHEIGGTDNYRYIRLTTPSGTERRNTNSTSTQRFETIGHNFLNQLELSINVAYSLQEYTVDMLFEKGLNIAMGSVGSTANFIIEVMEQYNNESNATLKTRIFNVIKSGVMAWNPGYTAIALGVAEGVIYSSFGVTYIVQLNNLEGYFESFART